MTLRVMLAADYHAEKGLPLSLSQSMAHTLVSQSAAHAFLRHPKLGGQNRKATPAMERGTLVHELILGQGKLEGVEILDYDSYRSRAAQEERDWIVASGGVPMLRREYDELDRATRMISMNLRDSGITFEGHREGVALWTEFDDDGRPVPCKARIDHWSTGVIEDLKTTRSAHPDDCVKSIFEFGYDIQAAAYISAMQKLELGGDFGAVKFRFHFVELEAPHLFTTVEPDDSILAVGRSKWRRAINLWSKCLRENQWPGYHDGSYSASARPWDLRAELAMTADTESLMRFLDPEVMA